MCIMKLAEKYLTRQNSAMSGQNSVCLDTMTEQCVKVIFGSGLVLVSTDTPASTGVNRHTS